MFKYGCIRETHPINKIVYDVLFRHKAEIKSAMTPYVTDWRLQGAGIIEVRMEGFGYRSEHSDVRFQELAKIAGLMSEEAKKYLPEIKLAIGNLS